MRMSLLKVMGCLSLVSLLIACGGKGHSAAPPSDLMVEAGDTQVVLTWTPVPGVEYWAWSSTQPNVSTQTCMQSTGCNIMTKATSPFAVTGLTNGTAYSFTVNARTDSGPGGPGASPVAATPRLAGVAWFPIKTLTALNIRAVAAGKVTNPGATVATGLLVAAGDNGSLYSSPDGATWKALTSGTSAQLRGVSYAFGKFYAAGQTGTMLSSTDGIAWTRVTLPSAEDLNGLHFNGTRLLAVGRNGTLLTTLNGTDWTVISTGAGEELHAAVYSPAGFWVVAGNGSAVYKSVDGLNWTASSAATSGVWRSAAYLGQASTVNGVTSTVYRLAMVSSSGQTATSLDGVNWTTSSTTALSGLTGVAAGSEQFVAVGNAGVVLTSSDGSTWLARDSGTSQNLQALVRYTNVYFAFGDQGAGIFSK